MSKTRILFILLALLVCAPGCDDGTGVPPQDTTIADVDTDRDGVPAGDAAVGDVTPSDANQVDLAQTDMDTNDPLDTDSTGDMMALDMSDRDTAEPRDFDADGDVNAGAATQVDVSDINADGTDSQMQDLADATMDTDADLPEMCGSMLLTTCTDAGLTCCNDECADVQTDQNHCGACGVTCTMDEVCESGGCLPIVWPNGLSQANSDPWLREHHQKVRVLKPKVLVLDVVNKPSTESLPIDQFVPKLMAAFAEGSRYHGYSDANAEPALDYQLDKIVNLRDPNGAEYPAFWPTSTSQGWDAGFLFSEGFAPRLGYEDPSAPGTFLSMCEIFEAGLVHELWISAGGGRNIYENQSYVQIYDDSLNPVSGAFSKCTNGCFHDPNNQVNCSVTVRMQEINITRGVGCGTHAAGHAQENLRNSIPYMQANSVRFYGFDLDTQYGLSQNTLYYCPYESGNCVEHPSPGRLVSAEKWPGTPFDVSDWGTGCGNVHFPPNATSQYDYYAQTPALSSCESYGLGGGANGRDATTAYEGSRVAAYDQQYGDCGGGWMIYMNQSMPGYGNQATDTDGNPMLNWWPFLFY